MVSIFDHSRLRPWIATAALLGGCVWAATPPAGPSRAPAPANDFPTYARVQFVEECMGRNGRSETNVYKCSCVVDYIAAHLSFDRFVEASTYAHDARMGGDKGGIFRDHPLAKQSAKLYESVETAAYRSCGLRAPAG